MAGNETGREVGGYQTFENRKFLNFPEIFPVRGNSGKSRRLLIYAGGEGMVYGLCSCQSTVELIVA